MLVVDSCEVEAPGPKKPPGQATLVRSHNKRLPGIAASNIEIERTNVRASTIHALFEFDNEFKTKIDFSKRTASVGELLGLEVLLLDEVSMVDDACFNGICDTLSIIDHTRRPNERPSDCFGPMHVCLFGDFKQLPPATSRPPFIVHPRVPREFDFRCLRENRRVVQDESRRDELDFFHKVLTDISQGDASNDVHGFIVDAYVRGYKVGCAENVPFEGSTAVFAKRRYRDKWNRTVVRRIAKVHNHSIKIKGKVRARGVRSQQWYSDQRVAYLRKKCRAQSLWNLHLAGDWHHSMETMQRGPKPHLMRVMIVSNIAVNERFANGTQGRLLHWHPGATESKRRALPAYCPDLLARFCKESSMAKLEMMPGSMCFFLCNVQVRKTNNNPLPSHLPIFDIELKTISRFRFYGPGSKK